MSAAEIQNAALRFAADNAKIMDTFAKSADTMLHTDVNMTTWASPPTYVWGYNGGIVNPPADIALPQITATKPTAPAMGTVPTLTLPTAPTLTAAMPVLNFPTTPGTALPAAPGAAPTFNTPAVPDAPTLSLPAVPTFTPVVAPAMPAIDNPIFAEMLPADTLVPPSETFSFVEQEYRSALLDELKAKLMTDLVNGGYGIEPADESALWERAREREMRNMEAVIQDAARQAAARGFMLPPGALNTAILQAQQDAAEKISSTSREIALKRADMYVENRKFTITEVRQVEDMLIRMFGFMMERALNAAKALVELGIAAFNARLAQHNYRLERFKTSASVYETLIRAQLAKLEQYKTQVEAARLTLDQQKLHAEVYRIQLDGVQALINVYRTQMDASKVAAEIEQLKMQGFRTSVEAYTAQVQAKTAEFGMYEAGIRGETAKISAYDSQVRAYGSEVSAFKTKIDAQEVQVRAAVQTNSLLLDSYKADLARYNAELQASQQQLQAALTKYEGDIRKYNVTSDAALRSSQQNIEASKANADIAVSNAQVMSSFAIQAGQVLAAKATAAGATMGHISAAYGHASASALTAATGIEANIVSG